MRLGPVVVALVVVVAVVAFVLLRRQAPPAEEPAPVPVAVDAGTRIVSLAPSVTELLFALGVGDQVAGRTLHCDHPPEVAALPSIGSGTEPDVEAILSLRPTLVVGARMQAEYPAIQALRAADVEVILVPDQTVADIRSAITELGAYLGRAMEANELLRRIDDALATATSATSYTTSPIVAVVVGTDPIYVAGSETYIHTMVQAAGGTNPVSGSWVALDDEAFIALNADIVILPLDDPSELAVFDRFGTSFPAVRDDRICGVDRDVLSRAGPRIPEAMTAIAECISTRWAHAAVPPAGPTRVDGSGEGAPTGP